MAREHSDAIEPDSKRSSTQAAHQAAQHDSTADEQSPLLYKKSDDQDDQQSTSQEEGDLMDILPEDETPARKLVLHEFWILFKGSFQ